VCGGHFAAELFFAGALFSSSQGVPLLSGSKLVAPARFNQDPGGIGVSSGPLGNVLNRGKD